MKSDEFIREVDEELRRDRFATLWRRYGAMVLGAAILIVAATAAKVGWDHWAAQARAAEATRFVAAQQALQAGNHAEAAAQFAALAAEGKTGFAELARLKEAEAKLGRKDTARMMTWEVMAGTHDPPVPPWPRRCAWRAGARVIDHLRRRNACAAAIAVW